MNFWEVEDTLLFKPFWLKKGFIGTLYFWKVGKPLFTYLKSSSNNIKVILKETLPIGSRVGLYGRG